MSAISNPMDLPLRGSFIIFMVSQIEIQFQKFWPHTMLDFETGFSSGLVNQDLSWCDGND